MSPARIFRLKSNWQAQYGSNSCRIIAMPKRFLSSGANYKSTSIGTTSVADSKMVIIRDQKSKVETSSTQKRKRQTTHEDRHTLQDHEQSGDAGSLLQSTSDDMSSRTRSKSAKPPEAIDSDADTTASRNTKKRPRKKPKRPSLTDIEEVVDDIAEEMNKQADEVVAAVRRVPLPPASSDVEREELVRSSMNSKEKSLLAKSSRKAAARPAIRPSLGETWRVGDTVNDSPAVSRQLSSSTLVISSSQSSISTKRGLGSTSTSLSTSAPIGPTRRTIGPRQVSHSGRTKELDSEPDPLDLFTC